MLTAHTKSYVVMAACAMTIALTVACTRSPSSPSSLAISTQPQSQSVAYGASATLSVAATGSGALSYQWYVGASGTTTAPIQGATAASYSTPGLTATTSYWVRVSDSRSQADSVTATVTVSQVVAPTITRQPQDVTIDAGDHATLSVEASGTAPLSYQWFEMSNGVEHVIDGATGASYVTPAQTANVPYMVRVTNAAGSVDSNIVTVAIASTAENAGSN
ncbi:MAG TPA: hypothetical protein VLT86_12250 [Vicinamibacterales bacterium]|nr:hypothetical protein [Vicinamibacterales bacterium]